MNKLQFTPGPWNVYKWSPGEPYLDIVNFDIVDMDNRACATIYTYNGVTKEEGMANAQLISAAPDMYEACNSALMYLDILYPDKTRCHPKQVMNALSAALAKARGGDG